MDRIIAIVIIGAIAALTAAAEFEAIEPTPDADLLGQDSAFWYSVAEEQLKRNLEATRAPKLGVARNVVVFIGDGMGISTVTAARIYKGQREFRKSGEEHNLVFETFPNVGLVKTYNVDMQVPDSAGTATALFTGVKTRYEAIGLDVTNNKNVFDREVYEQGRTESIMTWAQRANKDTGIITTTRISHATPAATYAHVNRRNWECDSKIPDETQKYVKDISRQLVEDAPGRNFKVILGGGYQQLGHIAKNESDECVRTDGRNLTKAWVNRHQNFSAVFATKTEDLDKVTDDTEYLLGLFHADNLPYELIRDKGPRGSPSLTHMVQKGLQVLKKSKNGFVLMVEGGRIDHGHHANEARIAMGEAAEFDRAISLMVNETGPETLIIVTADHSHSMTLNGYGRRGNDILGYGIHDKNAKKPSLTLTYANGPGFAYHYSPQNQSVLGPWRDVRNDTNRLSDPRYQHMATYDLDDETHGGEDVGIYATGPGSDLVRGVMEQNYVAHVVSFAACIGPRASLNPECGPGASIFPEKAAVSSAASRVTTFLVSFIILIVAGNAL